MAQTGLQVEEEREHTVNRSNESSTHATAAENDEVVTFNNPIPTRVVCPSPRDVVANLNIDEGEGYADKESDDEDLDDSSNEKQSSTCTLDSNNNIYTQSKNGYSMKSAVNFQPQKNGGCWCT